jgi:tetratricopeptide (TPR) repeat protein
MRRAGRIPSLVVLRGPGGVGKSAIALRWLDTALDRFPDGQLYAELTQANGEPVAVEDVLGSFLRALGVPPDRVPNGFAERAALYRSVTANRSTVLLLEDAISAAQVKTLLPTSGTSAVLVTTRHTLAGLLTEGASVVAVEPLDPADAMDLMEQQVGTDRLAPERQSAESLLRLCAGLPVALCVAAALIMIRPRRSVADLVTELRDEHRRLDVLSVDDLSVRATFDVSYRGLPARARDTYQALGVHAGSVITAELVAAVRGVSLADARAGLHDLVGASLLIEVDDVQYRCHALVHAHARAVTTQDVDPERRMAMERAALEWHLFVAQAAEVAVLPARTLRPFAFTRRHDLPDGVTEHRGALAWLERHRLDLAEALRAALHSGYYELAYKLGRALQPLFIHHKHYREAAEVDRLALEAATAWGDPAAEADMRNRLARVLLRLGDVDAAQPHVEELLRSTRARGDRHDLANALQTLGGLHHRTGDHQRSARAFEEALATIRGQGYPRTEALAHIDLGTALVEAGDFRRAATHLVEARAILSILDPPDGYNFARTATILARAHRELDELDAARQLLTETLPVLAALDSDHELARAHEELAAVLGAAGDVDGAREHAREATRLRSAAG